MQHAYTLIVTLSIFLNNVTISILTKHETCFLDKITNFNKTCDMHIK